MNNLLQNKVAVITGSAKGIGAVTAKLLSDSGASVVINYRNSRKEAMSLVRLIKKKNGNAVAIQADVSQPGDVSHIINETLSQFGKIDILVNNVSEYTSPRKISNTTWALFQKEIDGSVKPAYLCTKTVIPHMKKQNYGRIINIVTTLVTRPASGYSAHITAKSAILGLTKSAAKELGSHGITVNMISPGMVLTGKNLKLSNITRESIAKKTPLSRLATPEDIAKAILFFASDLSSFITGAYLPVDGGLSIY